MVSINEGFKKIKVFLGSLALQDTGHNLLDPVEAFPAGCTLTAGLVVEKARQNIGGLDHVSCLVHYHDRP